MFKSEHALKSTPFVGLEMSFAKLLASVQFSNRDQAPLQTQFLGRHCYAADRCRGCSLGRLRRFLRLRHRVQSDFDFQVAVWPLRHGG